MIKLQPTTAVLFTLGLAVCSLARAETETLTLQPTGDSYIRASEGNQGANDMVIVGDTANADDYLRAVFAFDLSAPELFGATINSATLTLTINDKDTAGGGSGDHDQKIDLHQLSESFTNNRVTWTSRDGSNDWATPGGDFGDVLASVSANAGTVSGGDTFDFSSEALTSSVADALGESIHLIARLETEDAKRSVFRFASNENSRAEYRPVLSIEYEPDVSEPDRITGDDYVLSIQHVGFRIGMASAGGELKPDKAAGLWMRPGGSGDYLPARMATPVEADGHAYRVVFPDGLAAVVSVVPGSTSVRFAVEPEGEGEFDMRFQFAGGMNPAFGLGDHGGYKRGFNVYPYRSDRMFQHQGGQELRFVSTFALFPKHRLGMVVFDRHVKGVRIDEQATSMQLNGASRLDGFYLFTGEMPEIYAAFREARIAEGLLDAMPDPDFFYPGLESYGALAWDTNQETIQDMLGEYLQREYPLRWVVVGSGFWKNPRRNPSGPEGLTTSFGIWGQRYPDPDGMKALLKENDLKLIMGLRHGFKALPEHGGNHDDAVHGTFTRHALEQDYLLRDAEGELRTFNVHFPRGNSPVYLLDPDNEAGVEWFADQAELWGADGFKEDFMFDAGRSSYYDDYKLNPILEALERRGLMVMVRGAAYSVPGSILRINDTDIRHSRSDQDRVPINLLSFAASGQSNVYPDIIGGRPIGNWGDGQRRYLVRMAMMSAVTPAMSFGNPPWRMESELHERAALKSAQWHARHVPYIYSAAVQNYETGFPHNLTPLPVAYPDDPETYEMASHDRKQYQWLLGPSLMATPLFGSDYDTADARDVYLPEGLWMDYESGEIFTGPMTLEKRPIPLDAMPLFIGRTALVVHEDEEKTLRATFYPQVADGSDYSFIDRNPEHRSEIRIEARQVSPESVQVVRADGGEVASELVRDGRGLSFVLEPGENYRIIEKP